MTAKKVKVTAVKPKLIEPVPVESTALVMHEVQLTKRQTSIIQAETPKALIKTKPGRGGKSVTYVEGGYVISKLNEAFSPLGWEFRIVEKGETQRENESNAEGEVWVYGELTIIDHEKGYRVSKGQYGQHPIHKKVPIGDAYKAAGTDALKKCASLLGIALDVYWGTLDKNEDEKPKAPSKEEVFERAKMMVRNSRDMGGLLEYQEKLKTGKAFTDDQKKQMLEIVKARLNQLDAESEKQA